MKNRNVKVIDEHNIDRNANIMFALDLDGSEYVVYWIERDEDSNNVFVSKVLKNLDNTYNMLNIDDADKKKEVADMVKVLITNAVSDQNDKMVGLTTTLSNGKVAKFIDVTFNKEQSINVAKTYITTVKKEVTKVAENYYDVVVEETKVADVLPAVTPVIEPVTEIFPETPAPLTVETPVVPPVVEPVVLETPVVTPEILPTPAPVENDTFVEFGTEPVATPAPAVVEPTPVVETPVVPAVTEPVLLETPVVEPTPAVVTPAPVTEPVVAPVVEPTPVAPAPVVEPAPVVVPEVVATPAPVENQPLVFNATNETNLNAALGEVASSATIPVENIEPVREFGVDAPVTESVVQQPAVAPVPETPITGEGQPIATGKAGFANSKFFMVVAVAFFLASCIFLGYEVYNYFQLVK